MVVDFVNLTNSKCSFQLELRFGRASDVFGIRVESAVGATALNWIISRFRMVCRPGLNRIETIAEGSRVIGIKSRKTFC